MSLPTGAPTPSVIHPPTARLAARVLRQLGAYHSYRTENMQAVPRMGAALLVVHHSFASYDLGLLAHAIYAAHGRVPRALVDRLFFRLPPAGWLISQLGSVEGKPEAGAALLRAGHLVMVAPGGMREALRPSSQKYALNWKSRRGFARLAVAAQVPVIPAACAAADDIYTLYDNPLTTWCLQHLHLPVPLLRGRGPTLLPRPVRLVHHIGAPLQPPKVAVTDARAVDAFAQEVASSVRALLARGTPAAGGRER